MSESDEDNDSDNGNDADDDDVKSSKKALSHLTQGQHSWDIVDLFYSIPGPIQGKALSHLV